MHKQDWLSDAWNFVGSVTQNIANAFNGNINTPTVRKPIDLFRWPTDGNQDITIFNFGVDTGASPVLRSLANVFKPALPGSLSRFGVDGDVATQQALHCLNCYLSSGITIVFRLEVNNRQLKTYEFTTESSFTARGTLRYTRTFSGSVDIAYPIFKDKIFLTTIVIPGFPVPIELRADVAPGLRISGESSLIALFQWDVSGSSKSGTTYDPNSRRFNTIRYSNNPRPTVSTGWETSKSRTVTFYLGLGLDASIFNTLYVSLYVIPLVEVMASKTGYGSSCQTTYTITPGIDIDVRTGVRLGQFGLQDFEMPFKLLAWRAGSTSWKGQMGRCAMGHHLEAQEDSGSAALPAPASNDTLGFAFCSDRCSEHGVCFMGRCSCHHGWTGEHCETATASTTCEKSCTVLDNSLKHCTHLRGVPVCVDPSNIAALDQASYDKSESYSRGGVACQQRMLALQCELHFPRCKDAKSHVVEEPMCLDTCTEVHKSCDLTNIDSAQECQEDAVDFHALAVAGEKCRSYRVQPIGQCTPVPAGLKGCPHLEGKHVFHYSSAFETLQLVDTYIGAEVAKANLSGECWATAVASICHMFMPECDAEKSSYLPMCASTCTDVFSKCTQLNQTHIKALCKGEWDGLVSQNGSHCSRISMANIYAAQQDPLPPNSVAAPRKNSLTPSHWALIGVGSGVAVALAVVLAVVALVLTRRMRAAAAPAAQELGETWMPEASETL